MQKYTLAKFKKQSYKKIQQNIAQEEIPTNLFEIIKLIVNRYRKRFALCITIMFASNFVYKGIFYTHVMMMKKIDKSDEYNDSYFVLPLIGASFLGPITLSRLFDIVGRKKMLFAIFMISGILLFINGILFEVEAISHEIQLVLWFFIFFFSSPGISAAHLTISEVFPLKIRSQALAIFNTIGLCAGGAFAPYFFGVLIRLNSIDSLSLGYYCSGCIMIIAAAVSLALGVRAENVPLEEV